MADNISNLNINTQLNNIQEKELTEFKNSFGTLVSNLWEHSINSIVSERELEAAKNSLGAIASNLWQDTFGFLEEGQFVFNGQVADEIKQVQSRMHSLGVEMRKDKEVRSFNRYF